MRPVDEPRGMAAVRPPLRPTWAIAHTDAEINKRLTLFTKLMFISFVTLLAFLMVMYRVYPEWQPVHNDLIFGGAIALLVVMGVVWRLVLERRTLTLPAITALEVIYSVSIGSAFGLSAVLSYPMRPAAYASLVYGVCTVFTRALVQPSTWQRTVFMSTLLFTPMNAAAVYLGVETPQELPGPAYAGAAFLLSGVAIVLAAFGSNIIYGLEKKVRTLGQYRLIRPVGSGGMGKVWEADHLLLRRRTAVKLISSQKLTKDARDRFHTEAFATSKLTHPNIVAVYDYGSQFDGDLYYAMEFIDGVDLQRLVDPARPEPIDRVVHILGCAAEALQEAHDAGLIHRDVKPANIMLCRRGRLLDFVKVVDFGLVHESANAIHAKLAGTPPYIAPETIRTREVTSAVDIYALGAVGYFLLVGTSIFHDAPMNIEKHAAESPIPLCAVTARPIPKALVDIISRCLARRPEDRYATAQELIDALRCVDQVGDWTAAMKKTWWDNFEERRQRLAISTDATTADVPVAGNSSVVVDLERRDRRATG